MKYIVLFSLVVFSYTQANCQTDTIDFSQSNKGKFYFYWGWNWSGYSNSDISFEGDNYDFTLSDVVANDRPTEFSVGKYFGLSSFTIPQYNFRVGYYFKDNWDVSFGIDHMKYVVEQNQTVEINGTIENTNTIFDGTYTNDNIVLTDDFLQFEHTDGLNFVNFDLRHTDELLKLNRVTVSLKEGIGAGILYPKTNTTLLDGEGYDEFHLSGYGVSGVLALNVTFFNRFFIQTEFKGGYINLPDVRVSARSSDKASQDFFFYQVNVVFGGLVNLQKKTPKN